MQSTQTDEDVRRNCFRRTRPPISPLEPPTKGGRTMKNLLIVPLLTAILAVSLAKDAAAGYCGACCYSRCAPTCGVNYCGARQQCCTVMKTCKEVVYEQQNYTCYKTCYETVCEPKTIDCVKYVSETAYRTCEYTVCKPVYETKVRTCSYTVCKPVYETKTREIQYTVCKPV